MDDRFDSDLTLGSSQALTGWDFSWLNARTTEEPIPWDYRALVIDRLGGWQTRSGSRHAVNALLDVGTGGGEFYGKLLSELATRPASVWATEGYSPNVPIARQRLEPLGVTLLDVSNESGAGFADLPEAHFDLVIDRHEGIPGHHLARVLRPGGRYITQQVGGQNCIAINQALQDQPHYIYANTTLAEMTRDLEQAGLRVLQAREAFPAWRFHDIAALVFYLQAVPWQVEGFQVETYREKLYAIHQQIEREGGWTVKEHRLLIEAEKAYL